MKHLRVVATFAFVVCALFVAGHASAQTTPGTRSTPCSPNTPNNAICIDADAVTTYSDNTTIPSSVAVTYRLERRLGTTGTWAAVGSAQSSPRFYVTSLTPGTYYFREFAIAGGAESVASNVASGEASSSTPSAPVIRVTKVTISSDRAPVYEVMPDEVAFEYDRGRQVGSVRVGNVCDVDRTTGNGYFALRRPSAARLTRSRSSRALPTALVAKCA